MTVSLNTDDKGNLYLGPPGMLGVELPLSSDVMWTRQMAAYAASAVGTVEDRQADEPLAPATVAAVTIPVNANGDVQLCETTASHPPVGNLREKSFREIWSSPEAQAQRERIRRKECHCTNEVFLWPSFTFAPAQLGRAMLGARVWQRPERLPASERAPLPVQEERA